VQVTSSNPQHSPQPVSFVMTNAVVQTNSWHHLALTYQNGTDSGGLLKVSLDGHEAEAQGFPRVNVAGLGQALLGAESATPPGNLFHGKVDELWIWNAALSDAEIAGAVTGGDGSPALAGRLVAQFDLDEGQGSVAYGAAGNNHGTIYGDYQWSYGQIVSTEEWEGYPGYVHTPEGDRYHINDYNYPTAQNPGASSHLFAVNTGSLEVWWANQSRNTNMPAVYYPSRVMRYTNSWPANPLEIVLASGLGSGGAQPEGAGTWDVAQALGSSLYYQNDPTLPGYNPNEEHALILEGTVYAFRDDLNVPATSEPFVLVNYTDGSGRPQLQPFAVRTTNALYTFDRDVVAGDPIELIQPLAAFPPTVNTSTDDPVRAWRDRKLGWWARSAGDDGAPATAVLRFYYPMQPAFYFPDLAGDRQPPAGTELPWRPFNPHQSITNGLPAPFTYHVTWPDEVPELALGQTLTVASGGLPDVWDQLSVEVVYQQSQQRGTNALSSVDLFDPIAAHGVDLAPGIINAMVAAQKARTDLASGLVRFPDLPPSLYPRLYYDPHAGTQGQLVLQGQQVQTLTGSGYLLLNLLEDFEEAALLGQLAATDPNYQAWSLAVQHLPRAVTPIRPNQPFVNAALAARLSEGHGYVTLAFNNSTNEQQVPPGLPVSLSVLRVGTQLYSGALEVIAPEDVLAESLSLRYSADFAGHAEQCEFRWRYVDPLGGLIPNTNFLTYWRPYGPDPSPSTNEVTIAGASPFTLADHYFAVQYRPISS
ncbi:MAG: LamG domain-containing protein, partial [Verrucomicrobiae bacterium]|nr:LamG domain-containing protein [Verrucomicrobiae bacterium]